MDTSDASRSFVPSRRWRMIVAVCTAALVLVVDRVTKLAVQAALVPMADGSLGFRAPFVPGVIELFYVENTGAAFGMGAGAGLFFVAIAVIAFVVSTVYLMRAPLISKFEVIGLALMVGGGIGNAVDRLLFGYVVDFLATEFIEFPVFNVADIGITCGVAIAFAGFAIFSPANKIDSTTDSCCRDSKGGR